MKQEFQLSANVSLLFGEHPFLERFGAAAKAGFSAVECQFPYDYPASELALRLRDNGLVMNGVNTPLERSLPNAFGFAAAPGEQARFRAGFDIALDYARVLGAQTIHCMSGVTAPHLAEQARGTFLENMVWASAGARSIGAALLIEPLNSRDRPGYFVSRSDEIIELLAELDCDNVKLLFDVYHIQIMEGDLLARLGRHWPNIGHVQLASVPDRHEPDEGEVRVEAILQELCRLGHKGFVGAEYNPRGATSAGLGWARAWLGPRNRILE